MYFTEVLLGVILYVCIYINIYLREISIKYVNTFVLYNIIYYMVAMPNSEHLIRAI